VYNYGSKRNFRFILPLIVEISFRDYLRAERKREETRIMKKEKKAYKGWVDPMATPYQYKKG